VRRLNAGARRAWSGRFSPRLGRWWLIVQPGEEVDVSSVDPGVEVDLHLVLRTMTEIWNFKKLVA
jgi:hypothetical protein